MNERPIYFGDKGNLLGILTLPDEPDAALPVIVFLNAGLLHRVGPNRLHVDVARRLARRGYTSLRFDMSGVGDSELHGETMLYIERSVRDVIEALDMLDSTVDARRYVLIGLCTGAYNAFRAALADERVTGAVLLDGYSYPTLRSKAQHYGPRVLQLRRWTRYARRKLGFGAGYAEPGGGDLIVFENEYVPRARFARELQALIDRRTDLLMVYTGLGPLAYTYEDQLADALPDVDLDEQVRVRFHPDADHTFMLPGHRAWLVAEMEDWLHETYEGAPRR